MREQLGMTGDRKKVMEKQIGRNTWVHAYAVRRSLVGSHLVVCDGLLILCKDSCALNYTHACLAYSMHDDSCVLAYVNGLTYMQPWFRVCYMIQVSWLWSMCVV